MKRYIDIRFKNKFLLVQILLLFVITLPVFSEETKVSQDSIFCFVGDTGHVNKIQKEGKNIMTVEDFSRGYPKELEEIKKICFK